MRGWVTRSELFAALFFLGCANGLAAKASSAVARMGWAEAIIGTFDVSAIVLAACTAGLWLIAHAEKQQVTSADLAIGGAAFVLIALPIGGLSWLALTCLALYILLLTDADPSLRRGATILLATTVAMLWSSVLFQFFASRILEIDASLVATLLDTPRVGNMVRFLDGDGYLVIFPACSSLANMSLAFLCWITISEWVGHRRSIHDLWWGLLACGSVIAINVGRMSLMGISHRHYDIIHTGIGDAAASAMIVAVTVGWSLLGARRELFLRA